MQTYVANAIISWSLWISSVVDPAGRLKTRDWKTRDHNTGGGKRGTISYGTPK